MAYRNKTFVSFASEDIAYYRLMTAWNVSENIAFDFLDAHDINIALDTSQPETIRRRLRERLSNTKQVVMLIGDETRAKSARSSSFIHYESDVIASLETPVVLANLNGTRDADPSRIPEPIVHLNTVTVSFNARIIQFALDNFPDEWATHHRAREGTAEGLRRYNDEIYRRVGL